MARYSDTYIDRLLGSGKYDALVELQGIFCGWSGLVSDHPRNESVCSQWLFELLRQNRKELAALYA